MKAVTIERVSGRNVTAQVLEINPDLLGKALQFPRVETVTVRSGETAREACARAFPGWTIYESEAAFAAAVETLLIAQGFRVRDPFTGRCVLSEREQRIERGETTREQEERARG